MAPTNTLIVLACCLAVGLCASQTSKPSTISTGPVAAQDKQPVKKSITETSDLKTDSSYGLGYGLSYPYYGYGGLGSLGHGLGYGGGYGGYYGGGSGIGSKGFVLPVFNYGIGGLGYGAYTGGKLGYSGYPYGYSNIALGHYGYPYGSSYYSHPYGSSYYSGGHGDGYYGHSGYGGYGGYGGHGGYSGHGYY